MIKEEYTFTEIEMSDLLKYIVSIYSRKKFTEDDLKRIIDGVEKKKSNRRKTGFNIFMDELRHENKGKRQSDLFKKGGTDWQELPEIKKNEYKKTAYQLLQHTEENKEENKEELDDFIKMELKCKNNNKSWMYKIDNDVLVIKEGNIETKLKEDIINFNDEEQLECYLNKQIILKKNRGYVEV